MSKRLSILQRTFSAFPGGRAGVGLLLLRIALGAELAWCSYELLFPWQNAKARVAAIALLTLASGISLALGFLTVLSSTCATILSLGIVASWFPAPTTEVDAVRLSSVFAAIIALSLAFIGPGAFSLDARRYGRREIIIPKRPPPEE
jgi:uncharacterized membrane protein YphA (DoxX/SURF4 family)